jgi:uncharacterized coiled-coil DUF342 family protein
MTQKTEQLDLEVLNQIRELNARKNTLVTMFGQIHVRRQELSAEIDKLYELEEETNVSFKNATKGLQDILDKLGETYNQGSIDINNGTVTYLVEEVEPFEEVKENND